VAKSKPMGSSVVAWENRHWTERGTKRGWKGRERERLCVCVCGREGRRDGQREREREREFSTCMRAPMNIEPSISNVGSRQVGELSIT
jgi:hypothetical protein